MIIVVSVSLSVINPSVRLHLQETMNHARVWLINGSNFSCCTLIARSHGLHYFQFDAVKKL